MLASLYYWHESRKVASKTRNLTLSSIFLKNKQNAFLFIQLRDLGSRYCRGHDHRLVRATLQLKLPKKTRYNFSKLQKIPRTEDEIDDYLSNLKQETKELRDIIREDDKNNVQKYYNIFGGSVIGMAAFYPLDTLRSRIQVEDTKKLQGSPWELLVKMADEEGFESLYRGLSPVLQSLSVSNFVYFYSFHALRNVASKDNSALKDLFFGIVAGTINVLLTSPLWVVNTRMKLDKKSYGSLFEGLVDIAKKEGAQGLWSGTIPSLLLVSNPAIQFMVYETLKRDLVSRKRFDTYSAFLIGAIAKAIATTVTYPIQLIQSRLRAGTSLRPLIKDFKSNPLIMFRGLEAKLLQTVMTAALMFFIYEKLVRLVLSIMRVRLVKKH